jgi:hypothetical protein
MAGARKRGCGSLGSALSSAGFHYALSVFAKSDRLLAKRSGTEGKKRDSFTAHTVVFMVSVVK